MPGHHNHLTLAVDLRAMFRQTGRMDREWRNWLRSLGPSRIEGVDLETDLSPEATDYLVKITADGTLKAALEELGATEPDRAG